MIEGAVVELPRPCGTCGSTESRAIPITINAGWVLTDVRECLLCGGRKIVTTEVAA